MNEREHCKKTLQCCATRADPDPGDIEMSEDDGSGSGEDWTEMGGDQNLLWNMIP